MAEATVRLPVGNRADAAAAFGRHCRGFAVAGLAGRSLLANLERFEFRATSIW